MTAPRSSDAVSVSAAGREIEKVVGEGGMGIVYAAHHTVLDQRVALKLLLVDALQGAETVERFVREAQAAARLRSEHVVRVMDAGALDGGLPFLVMEFLQGCDLAELLALEGRLEPADVADCMLQALAALSQAHAAGIVHRDLKPANLFLATRDDGSNVVKVLDFGISKQQSAKAQWKELTGKAVLGTPAYMSPEQLRSSKNVDARADIWSLGIVIYELLTGSLPFDGEGPGEIFAAVLEKTPEPLAARRGDVDPVWQSIIARCLRRAPDERFQSVAELAQALAPLGSGRWAHLVPAVEQHLSEPAPSLSNVGAALVERAVAAAVTSLPPPRREARRFAKSRSATFVTDKTMFADVATTSRRPRRLARRPAAVAFALLGVALTILGGATLRGRPRAAASRELRSPVLAPASASAPAMSETATEPQPPPAPPPVEAQPEPPPSAAASDAPAPSKSPVGAKRGNSAPGRPAVVDTRPKFLKSWR